MAKATLWLGPEDGKELEAGAELIRSGKWLVTGKGKAGVLTGTYRLKVASDGIAVLDNQGRLTFEWDGWTTCS